MTKNNAHQVSKYIYTKDEVILIDANIWLYLFPAPSGGNNKLTRTYSAAFKVMLSSGVRLAINSLILSEYLNRYCRIEWSALHKTTYSDFKNFRRSSDYSSVGSQASAFASDILKYCFPCDDGFASADVKKILQCFESGEADFNDGIIVDSCRRQGWKLLTHDGDFVHGGIEVLTENQKLIASCS